MPQSMTGFGGLDKGGKWKFLFFFVCVKHSFLYYLFPLFFNKYLYEFNANSTSIETNKILLN